jgi:hypothetical protein
MRTSNTQLYLQAKACYSLPHSILVCESYQLILVNRYVSTVATGQVYPLRLPIKQDTVPLTIWSDPEDKFGLDDEVGWASLFPPGGGFVYLGPEKRRYGIEMFHSVSVSLIRRSIKY